MVNFQLSTYTKFNYKIKPSKYINFLSQNVNKIFQNVLNFPMLIFSQITPLFTIMLLTSLIFPQFEEVNVMIDTRQVRENARFIFESLGDDVSQYLTNNKFIDNAFDLEMFLDIHFIIESYSSSDNKKIVSAQMILTNQADQHFYAKGVDFPYSKGQSLTFSTMFSPLTSVLDYYANLFIATELDTYDYLGGDTYFVKSDEITNSGRSSDYSRGWENRKKKSTKLKDNRYLRAIRFHYFAVKDILNSEKIDRDYEKEVFSITKFITSKTSVINGDSADIKYRTASGLILNWPNLSASTTGEAHVDRELTKISTSDERSLVEFIDSSKDQGLTHLAVDGREHQPGFLRDVFYNDEKYPYLKIIYDSSELGMKYHVKIYEIDFVRMYEN